MKIPRSIDVFEIMIANIDLMACGLYKWMSRVESSKEDKIPDGSSLDSTVQYVSFPNRIFYI